VISGFRCDVDEICALLGHYAASSGNPYHLTLHVISQKSADFTCISVQKTFVFGVIFRINHAYISSIKNINKINK
jgi:hypothetical protein